MPCIQGKEYKLGIWSIWSLPQVAALWTPDSTLSKLS